MKARVRRRVLLQVTGLGTSVTCAPTQRVGYASEVPYWIFMRLVASVLSEHQICGL
jgi:hypothetical protein